jgi:hypothetical protein
LELFETLRQELAAVPAETETVVAAAPEPEPEAVLPDPEPEPEPAVAADPEPEPEQPESDPPSDELPAALRATSPLLSRAFAATGHQRSVLTQQGPQEPSED